MNYWIRELQLPGDYEGIAAVWNEVLAEPKTAETLADEDSKMYKKGQLYRGSDGRLQGYDRLRRVAVAGDGRIVAYSTIWRAPWTPPGMMYHEMAVAAKEQGNGIGTELARISTEWANRHGAGTLSGWVWDDDERSMAFLQKRGYEVERRSWQSVLDLSAGEDPSSPEDGAVINRLEDEGLRFLALADLPPGEDTLKQLHELSTGTYRDIPGYQGDILPFEDWLKWGLKVDGYAPERVIIAADGDNPIGVCNVIRNVETGGMYHEYTCVHRDYRGRGIALAMKLLSIRLALREGAGYLRTDNDSLNAPMLAVNRRLGYKALRGSFRMIAKLGAASEAASVVASAGVKSDV
ncbi:Acetyltransferase (GNAT) family protein [Paenibacillaceae bacterium GAS479]|nr:Acetyltransferase (GNAT) family protein [Paenibacillaceae bacterium GAS479]